MAPLIATSARAKALHRRIDQHSIPVTIFIVEDYADTIECPCVQQSMWHKYDPTWHQKNMQAVDCLATGLLVADGSRAVEVIAVQKEMILIPKYAFGGWEFIARTVTQEPNWSWMAISYENFRFNRLDFTDNNNSQYFFRVTADNPYYIEKEATPIVMLYLLEPLTKQIREY